MSPSEAARAAREPDWVGTFRRAAESARRALEGYGTTAERSVGTGRGEGGDETLVIDRAAEDAVFAELESLGVGLTAISEERGEVAVAGGGPLHVVIDPVDGSLNAKRRLPGHCISIALATGPTVGQVQLGYVHDLVTGQEWLAARGGGARLDDLALPPLEPGPVELLGLESANPKLVEERAAAVASSGARRLRVIGSIALSLCSVAAGRLDAMVSLAPCRSVDMAAAQLLVTEAGGAVVLPDAGTDLAAASLTLEMRSRVAAARDPEALAQLVERVFRSG